MSIQKYDAFISYRHAPLDSKIAETIHRQLESFKIPKEIRNKITKKKITRIFRDKEELPVTSDINDNIKQALDNSENLIVICSHSLKDSIWVKREIEYFLESHSIEQVLTVLAEGEPCEVIPEILQYEKTETDKNTGESKKVLCEPLSCDYRLPKKQAKADELPRLAAAILGCSYDDLKQRQKQHRRRIITAALSCVFAFLAAMSVFFAYTANEIQKNYNNALINQSEYLISESQKAYESGDKITATLLAVEALPSEDNERPLLSEAVYNLESIINPYQNTTSTGYEPTTILRHREPFDTSLCYDFSPDGKHMAVKNGDSTITVWNTETNEKYFEKDFSENVLSFCFSKNDTLIIDVLSSLLSIDYHNNKELWSLTEKVNLFSFKKAVTCSVDNIMAMDCGNCIRLVDLTTGKKLSDIPLPENSSATCLTFSPNGENMAFVIDRTTVCVYNLEKEKLHTLKNEYTKVDNLAFGSDKEILIADASKNTANSGRIENGYYNYDSYVDFISIDITNDTVQYNCRLNFSDIYQGSYIKQTAYFADEKQNEVYICAAGNGCMIIDRKTGKTADLFYVTDSIVDVVDPDPSFESPESMCISFLLEEGSLSQHFFNDELSLNIPFFNENPVKIFSSNGKIYVVSDYLDTNITVYEFCSYSSSDWKKVGGDAVCDYGTKQIHETESFIVLQGTYSDIFTVINKETNSVTYRNTIPENSEEKNEDVLVFSENENELYVLTHDETAILKFNIETNECTTVKELEKYIDDVTIVKGGFCYTKNSTEETLFYEDMTTGEITTVNTGLSDKDKLLTFYPLKGKNSLVFSYKYYETRIDPEKPDEPIIEEFYAYKIADLNTGEILSCPESFFAEDSIVYPVIQNEDGSLLAVSTKDSVHIYDSSFKKISTVKLKNANTSSTFLTDKELYISYDEDNNLYIYSANTGKLTGAVNLSKELFSKPIFKQENDGPLLILDFDTLFTLDVKNKKLCSKIERCYGFDYEGRIIYTPFYNESTDKLDLGYFNLLDHNELIEMAKEKYPGVTLSEQQKTRYGID